MRVIETSMDENLAMLSAYLWSTGIVHRVFEERGRQVLEVRDPAHAAAVRAAYADWRAGRLQVAMPGAGAGRRPGPPLRVRLLAHVRAYPVLTAVIGAACLLLPTGLSLGAGDVSPLGAALLIVDPAHLAGQGSALEGLFAAQPWRWLTPVFLHFSFVHLAFNAVILLEFGRRIERGIGSVRFAVLVVFTGVVGNLAQFLIGNSILFGGLSGVAYGLLGFILVMARRRPGQPHWRLPPGIAVGLLVFLVVFSTGVTEPFGLHVANSAHWAGLFAGMTGALFASRRTAKEIDDATR